MKTIVEINNNNYGSTGNIMLNIAKESRKHNYTVYTSCSNSKQAHKFFNESHIYIGLWLDRIISERLAYATGLKDHFNILNTFMFINKLKRIKPDLIHLHNIHDTYLNHKMLFSYLSKLKIPVVWTFHDCWPITGQCTYFDLVKCNKWKTKCHNCPQIHKHPKTKIDRANILWEEKKTYFNSLNNLTIVTPSMWLSNLIHESFLNKFRIKVINNGIDLNKFKPIYNPFKIENNLNDKFVILGVAYNWTERKGLDVFIELSKRLSNDYQIVLVGTNDEIDKTLPKNIISIHKTYNQEELIKIYSSSDLFVNPTREENFPTVNIEALACGTPVLTFNTGGSIEMLDDTCGSIVQKDDIDQMENEIIRISKHRPYTKEACIKQASKYDMNIKFNEYIKLYDSILNK